MRNRITLNRLDARICAAHCQSYELWQGSAILVVQYTDLQHVYELATFQELAISNRKNMRCVLSCY